MSQPDAINSGKVEGTNTISSRLYDDMLDITAAISLKSGKVLDELVSKNDESRVKPGDDSTQQNNNNTNTTKQTYKPVIPFPQHLKSMNINTSYTKILDVFK